MARQVSIIVGILALLNAYAAWRIMARIPWAQEHTALAWLAMARPAASRPAPR